MSLEGEQFLAGGHLPQLHRPVFTARGEPPAIGTESHALHRARMSLEGEQLLAAGRLPQSHRPVTAGGGQVLAIRTEDQTAAGKPEGDGPMIMTEVRCVEHAQSTILRECDEFLAARCVPDL